MIVGVLTDFEMTFTGDRIKIAWQNNDFVFKVSIPTKMALVLAKNQVSDPGPSWPSCFFSNSVVKGPLSQGH